MTCEGFNLVMWWKKGFNFGLGQNLKKMQETSLELSLVAALFIVDLPILIKTTQNLKKKRRRSSGRGERRREEEEKKRKRKKGEKFGKRRRGKKREK